LTAWLFGKYSLKGKLQVEALLHYVIDEPPENADNKQAFKFPFIACEIFTCEIDVILKTLVEDEELMSLLFLFLEPDRPHGTLLAGYFSKVVSCLLFRKTIPVMRYLQVSLNLPSLFRSSTGLHHLWVQEAL
jgi:serine/threonine-protein phosphatase 6 regulatory subunit 3